ncbi:hypothetical protein JR315_26835 [Pseudomonas aeruginosa]|nr:hypothetical protein [Pseudomonas aeruginosa]
MSHDLGSRLPRPWTVAECPGGLVGLEASAFRVHGHNIADQRLLDSAPATFATSDMMDAVDRFTKEGAAVLNKGLTFKGE